MNDEHKYELLSVEEQQRITKDYNKIIEQGEQIAKVMDAIGLVEGSFKNGTRVTSTEKSKTISNDGIILIKNEHTTSIILKNEGSTNEDALSELEDIVQQKILGGFVRRSQSWVSHHYNAIEKIEEDDNDD